MLFNSRILKYSCPSRYEPRASILQDLADTGGLRVRLQACGELVPTTAKRRYITGTGGYSVLSIQNGDASSHSQWTIRVNGLNIQLQYAYVASVY